MSLSALRSPMQCEVLATSIRAHHPPSEIDVDAGPYFPATGVLCSRNHNLGSVTEWSDLPSP